jgi:SpoVK/Ycf46/Vps4 family AAA+-type ATPase
LRRPGRFDRELYFPLPTESAREKIISIATSKWTPPVAEDLKKDLAKATRGYCGADVKALCTEAALNAVRRSFPEIYESGHKLQLNMQEIAVAREDFAKGMKCKYNLIYSCEYFLNGEYYFLILFEIAIVPSTERSSTVHSKPIPPHIKPLLSRTFDRVMASLDILIPFLIESAEASAVSFERGRSGKITEVEDGSVSLEPFASSMSTLSYLRSMEPRLLISGRPGMGQKMLGPAALEVLEAQKVHVQSLDLSAILNESSRTPEAAVIQLLHELKRHRPAALYIPDVDMWWESLPETTKSIFMSMLERDPTDPVLLLATCERPFEELPEGLQRLIKGRLDSRSSVEPCQRVIETFLPNEVMWKGIWVVFGS